MNKRKKSHTIKGVRIIENKNENENEIKKIINNSLMMMIKNSMMMIKN